jgi:hypothetical protein
MSDYYIVDICCFLNDMVIKLHFKGINNTRLCASYCAWVILVGSWIYVYLLSVCLAHSHIESVLPFYSLEGYINDIGCSFKIHLQERIKAVAAVISSVLSKVWVVIYIYGVINAAYSKYIDDSVRNFKKSHYLLGVFVTLWKKTVGFVTPACLCGTTLLPLDGFSWNLRIVWKYVEKIQVSLNFDKNNRYFTCRPVYFYDNISLTSS